jgi:hypothetical protein
MSWEGRIERDKPWFVATTKRSRSLCQRAILSSSAIMLFAAGDCATVRDAPDPRCSLALWSRKVIV